MGYSAQKATSRFGILFPSVLFLPILCLSLFLLSVPVASCSLKNINHLSFQLMIKITDYFFCFLKISRMEKGWWMWIQYTWHYIKERFFQLVEVISSTLASLITFLLSVNQASIWKLSLEGFSSWELWESLHLSSKLTILMAKDLKTWNKNKKIINMRHWLYIISFSVYTG